MSARRFSAHFLVRNKMMASSAPRGRAPRPADRHEASRRRRTRCLHGGFRRTSWSETKSWPARRHVAALPGLRTDTRRAVVVELDVCTAVFGELPGPKQNHEQLGAT